MTKKLRLLLFTECERNCEGCCNKDWDLESIPVVESFKGYDEILLTGGEPMLKPVFVLDTMIKIREENESVKIYLYTAYLTVDLFFILEALHGIVITLHNQSDTHGFLLFDLELSKRSWHKSKSLRLNIFDNVSLPNIKLKCDWKIKKNIKWIKNCPLPKGEEFKRLKEA